MSLPMIAISSSNTSASDEDFQTLAKAMEQLIENVTAQGKINSAVVNRLLALEQRMDAITKGNTRRATSKKR